MEKSPPEADNSSANQEGPALYETEFIALFTRTRHLFISWAISIQSLPSHSIFKIRLNIILHLRLGISIDFFPLRFSAKTMHVFVFVTMRATYPPHLTVDFMRERCKQ
jgi:hypothetical protein